MTPPAPETLLLTLVHYRDAARVRQFLAHAARLPMPEGWRLACALCDNSGDWDGSIPIPGDVLTVRAGDNPGYSGGCERVR